MSPYKSSLAPTGIKFPNGLALSTAGAGTLFVAEGDGASVSVVQVLTSAGVTVSTWTNYNGTNFGEPYGVAVNQATSNVYVLDNLNNAVYEFTSAGVTVNTWGGFNAPEGIAFNQANTNVYVADTGNNQVKEFDQNGSPLNQWTTGVTAFSSPSAVAVDSSGTTLYVADAGNELIQIYNGSSWSSFPTIPGSDIFGITVDGSGHIYAADAANGLVEVYDQIGNVLSKWNGVPGGLFNSPDGVVLSGSDVFVSDFDNGASGTGSVEAFGP